MLIYVHARKKTNSEITMVSGSESEFSMESVDEREINRRVEFEDGRVVHLPNEMNDERVLEVLDNNEELQFYHRYDAGDIVLQRGEHHWDALSRRSEGTRRMLTVRNSTMCRPSVSACIRCFLFLVHVVSLTLSLYSFFRTALR